ncbi:hypothetical protein QWJ34_06825 [Saccharibacillus sp. CPCC 101409]|uniref:hypothetical protein n=1 Tax=Saccharibacillus sp. CPCC 101409 TaxID=3058041 RepID=UPI002673F0E1|nr:hypothetical protein [Saccharibacillus sp. CPCC 101409]MDO3409471.1 hypothetical protein [Saccharibacillus sp. CPCC 101409]
MSSLLRKNILNELKQKWISFSKLSELSKINRGVISSILRAESPKPISFNQFERIVDALDFPLEKMLEEYIQECFYNNKPNLFLFR